MWRYATSYGMFSDPKERECIANKMNLMKECFFKNWLLWRQNERLIPKLDWWGEAWLVGHKILKNDMWLIWHVSILVTQEKRDLILVVLLWYDMMMTDCTIRKCLLIQQHIILLHRRHHLCTINCEAVCTGVRTQEKWLISKYINNLTIRTHSPNTLQDD